MTGPISTIREMVDTNIFVYAADPSAGVRRAASAELIHRLIDQDRLAVSAQVLNEFYWRATRPNRPPALTHEQAGQVVRVLADSSVVLPITRSVTLRALDAVARYSFSWWDALIWAVAAENGIPTLYTEDFQHGRDIEGVKIINPFVVHG